MGLVFWIYEVKRFVFPHSSTQVQFVGALSTKIIETKSKLGI